MEFSIAAIDLPIRIRPQRQMSDEELLRFCAANELLRIEREPNGELSVMSPSGTGTGLSNAYLTYQLVKWADEDGRGTAFDSNTGFTLSDGSVRSPDASWTTWAKWNSLSEEQQKGYAPLCPEFIVELRSPSDPLPALQDKMTHWLRNGAELAWLIDPERQTVEVYRPGAETPDVLPGVTAVYGEGPVAGFVLEMSRIWR